MSTPLAWRIRRKCAWNPKLRSNYGHSQSPRGDVPESWAIERATWLEQCLLDAVPMKPTAARAWRTRPARERLRCIVLESGSTPISERHADDFDETIAVAQLPGELPATFAQRTIARVAGIERSGRHFESITVLTGGRHDDASKAARRLIVLGLTTHAEVHAPEAELLLQAPATVGAQERSELLELAGAVTEMSGGVAVRLCFGNAQKHQGQDRPTRPDRSTQQDRPSGVFAKLA